VYPPPLPSMGGMSASDASLMSIWVSQIQETAETRIDIQHSFSISFFTHLYALEAAVVQRSKLI
jgi:hypothetical protein